MSYIKIVVQDDENIDYDKYVVCLEFRIWSLDMRAISNDESFIMVGRNNVDKLEELISLIKRNSDYNDGIEISYELEPTRSIMNKTKKLKGSNIYYSFTKFLEDYPDLAAAYKDAYKAFDIKHDESGVIYDVDLLDI